VRATSKKHDLEIAVANKLRQIFPQFGNQDIASALRFIDRNTLNRVCIIIDSNADILGRPETSRLILSEEPLVDAVGRDNDSKETDRCRDKLEKLELRLRRAYDNNTPEAKDIEFDVIKWVRRTIETLVGKPRQADFLTFDVGSAPSANSIK